MIALGSDHVGFKYKEQIKHFLTEMEKEVLDFGCQSPQRTDYPLYAREVALAVTNQQCTRGILICGTGVGMSLAANQFDGIRAVVCSDPYSARMSRKHNDTNVLALGARVVGIELAKMIITNWLDIPFEGGRHQQRIDLIKSMRRERHEC